MNFTSQALAELTAAELAVITGQRIVQLGGESKDTRGNAIYAHRVDVRIPVDLYDPVLKRTVHVMAKIRITIEREV